MRSSRIWIVGLNPKGPPGTNPPRTVEDLEFHFGGKVYPYFHDLKLVSQRLYMLPGKEGGAAHSDIVKC